MERQRYFFDTMCEETARARDGMMNASMPQKSPGPPADLNHFDLRTTVEAFKAPPRVTKRDARKERAAVELEYGCVDWFQYRIQADEDETRH